MIGRLVIASLRQRPGRSALLLLGYALGVGVTVTLLSIGGALVEQSRDRELVGGGDLAVLPEGLDLETFRTGGTSSLYFRIDQTAFLVREVLGGARFREDVARVAPWIDDELVYVRTSDGPVAASARGEIPDAARAVGAAPSIVAGAWADDAGDRAWMNPTDSSLYARIDALHRPPASADSTWAEWHYFNVTVPGGGLYLTYMLAGDVTGGTGGGRLLATWDDGRVTRAFERRLPADSVVFEPGRPGLAIGGSSVRILADGTYEVRARVADPASPEPLGVRLLIRAARRRYLPPVAIGGRTLVSGYAVPLLDARAEGTVCVGAACRTLDGAPAYHDHNWGVWRDVTWDWGQMNTGDGLSVLYGGVSRAGTPVGSRFAYLFDAGGFLRVLPIDALEVSWSGDEGDGARPTALSLTAARGADTLRLRAEVDAVRRTPATDGPGTGGAAFYQMRATARVSGRIAGQRLEGTGRGAFETWRRPRLSRRE